MKNNINYYSMFFLMIACFLVFILGFKSLVDEPIFNIVFNTSDALWVCAASVLSLMAIGLKLTKP